MSRILPAPADQVEPLFGPDAPLRQQVYSWTPALARPYVEFMTVLRKNSVLPSRLVELVRLRVAFHNQCRSCMAVRYSEGRDDGVSDELVCSLERPEEAHDLSAAERAAIGFADKMATDHLAVTDETFAELGKHFTETELMDLCFQVATFVGYGRMGAALDMVDDLPEEYADRDAVLAPWRQQPHFLV